MHTHTRTHAHTHSYTYNTHTHTHTHTHTRTRIHIPWSGKITIVKHRPLQHFLVTKIDLMVGCILPRTQVKVANENIGSHICCVVIKSNADLHNYIT